MLKQEYRAKKADIEETIKSGKAISREYKEAPGFAFIVSKKTEKTSVGRHYIKRKTTALFEAELPKMKESFKKVMIFFPKKTENRIDFAKLKKEMIDILTKAEFF